MRPAITLAALAIALALPAAAPSAQPQGQLFCFANDAAVLYRVKLRHTPQGGSETDPSWRNVTAGMRHCERFTNPQRVRFQVQINDIRWKDSSTCTRTFNNPAQGLILRATGSLFSASCSVQ